MRLRRASGCRGCAGRRALLLAPLASWVTRALARLPPGAKAGPFGPWFEAQYSIRGAWCCDVSDGHELSDDQWKQDADGYLVFIGEPAKWYRIEGYMMRDTTRSGPNPTGHAIVWYTPLRYANGTMEPARIYCFAPGFEG